MKKKYILSLILIFFLKLGISQNIALYNTTAVGDSIIKYKTEMKSVNLNSYTQDLVNFKTRYATASNHRQVAVYLLNKFKSFGYQNAYLDSFTYSSTWQYNVIATLQGTTTPDSMYILGAHYDSNSSSNATVTAPGADDNASGAAGVLEVARAYKAGGFKPKSTIVFVEFAAEDVGLLGSKHYVNDAKTSGLKIAMMVNFDMISNETSSSNWTMKIEKYTGSEKVTALTKYITNNYSSLTPLEDLEHITCSDSYSFNQGGYKAVQLMENTYSPYYHSANDIVSNTNSNYATEICRVACGMLTYRNTYPLNTSMNDIADNISFSVYPNPANSYFNFSINHEKAEETILHIYDINGSIVLSKNLGIISTLDQKVDLSNISQGFYFVKISTKNKSLIQKLIVK